VFQDPNSSLDPSLPLWRIVTEPLWRSGAVRDPRQLRRQAAALLEDVDLDPSWIRRRRHELSGGQRQRVAIARAISHRPDVLIADEPTSALDVTVQVKVLDLLARLQKENNFACVFISHDLHVVSTISDRVIVMKSGQIVETGQTSEVIHNPKNEYTRTLLAAIPVPDPVIQRARREVVPISEAHLTSEYESRR
jgi:peptide/nickel transport system ATP-binding protein